MPVINFFKSSFATNSHPGLEEHNNKIRALNNENRKNELRINNLENEIRELRNKNVREQNARQEYQYHEFREQNTDQYIARREQELIEQNYRQDIARREQELTEQIYRQDIARREQELIFQNARQDLARREQELIEQNARQDIARLEQELREKNAVKQKLEEEIKLKLNEKQIEKERIEKEGWDCADYPRKLWQDPNSINIAVTGISGAGKSTLVNSFLGLKGADRAKIGVTECTDVLDRETFEPPRYSYFKTNEKNQNVKVLDVFDLPGCGTEKFPILSYIKDFGLRYFDMVIIVVAGRIYQADTMLKKELDKFNIPCIVVRNKVDLAVESNLLDNDIPEEETLTEIRADFLKNEIKDVLLISARFKNFEWDTFVLEVNRNIKQMRGNASFVEKDIDNTCDICWAAWIDTHFEPCGHRSICSNCARQSNQITNCYKCTKDIKNVKYDQIDNSTSGYHQ